MSTSRSVQNPNEKSNGGFWLALLAILLIAGLVIGLIVFNGRSKQESKGGDGEQGTEQVDQASPVDERMNKKYDEKVIGGLKLDYSADEGIITLTSDATADDAKKAALFQDYSCSYCADLAIETDKDMIAKINEGKVAVEIRPLNFLDRGQVNHSTRALAATLALVNDGDVATYWKLNAALMEDQANAYTNSSPDYLADLAQKLGASEKAVAEIREEKYNDEANQVGQKNAEWLQNETKTVSSPRVFVDGEEVKDNQFAWLDKI